ncbi:translation initiation factor IF-2 subunit gamma, partial [Candidatus Pacearchaeota archaeon]|nr:translation initiation factor IF-2 subunit gamma [Candidatus Pacearchaeota archaeon]
KPQTREHLMALQAKHVQRLIVVQNKIDLVEMDQAKKNYKEIKEMLKGNYDNAPIIPVSAQQGVNLNLIYQALAEIPLPVRKKEGDPMFIVARSFDINRPGTTPAQLHGAVLGGTLNQGTLRVGDEIEIKPGKVMKEANQYFYKPIITKVRRLFNGSTDVKELVPGGSMSVETELDMALGKGDALAGNVASLKGKLPAATTETNVKFTLFPEFYGSMGKAKVEPLKPSELLMLSINTSITGGVVKHVKGNEMDLSLKVPIVAFKGENVAIARNINNHWRLIGYGEII